MSEVVLTRCDDGGAVPTATSALEVVDGEVRELIRRRGLDPFTDPGPVRLLVRDVVADYSERSLTSALPPIGDPDAVVRDVLDRVAGFGPLQRWLDDPEVEEIWVNKPSSIKLLLRGLVRVLSPHRVRSSTENEICQAGGARPGAVLGRRPQVGVGVQCGGRRSVPKRPLHGHNVAASGDQAGGVEVSEPVQVQARRPGSPGGGLPPRVDGAGRGGAPVAGVEQPTLGRRPGPVRRVGRASQQADSAGRSFARIRTSAAPPADGARQPDLRDVA